LTRRAQPIALVVKRRGTRCTTLLGGFLLFLELAAAFGAIQNGGFREIQEASQPW